VSFTLGAPSTGWCHRVLWPEFWVPARVEALVADRRWMLRPLLGRPAGPEAGSDGVPTTCGAAAKTASNGR
jgi:hypothetical protein